MGSGSRIAGCQKTPLSHLSKLKMGSARFCPVGAMLMGKQRRPESSLLFNNIWRLSTLAVLLLKQTAHSGGRSLWKLWGRGGGEGSRPNACFSILVLPPCGKDLCQCRWNWNWWSYPTLWALLYWRTSSLPTTLEIGCQVFTTWHLGQSAWWTDGWEGNQGMFSWKYFHKTMENVWSGECLHQQQRPVGTGSRSRHTRLNFCSEKTSEYAPVEQPWGQEVQLWPM